jgi:hypothetical protein
MAAGKFEINKDKAGKYRWHLKARMARSSRRARRTRPKPTRRKAAKGIEAVKKAAADATVADLTEEGAKK